MTCQGFSVCQGLGSPPDISRISTVITHTLRHCYGEHLLITAETRKPCATSGVQGQGAGFAAKLTPDVSGAPRVC